MYRKISMNIIHCLLAVAILGVPGISQAFTETTQSYEDLQREEFSQEEQSPSEESVQLAQTNGCFLANDGTWKKWSQGRYVQCANPSSPRGMVNRGCFLANDGSWKKRTSGNRVIPCGTYSELFN